MNDQELGTYLFSLSARITELDAHVEALRKMLEGLGVSPEQYEKAHAPIVERLRDKHRRDLDDHVSRERQQRAAIDQLLGRSKDKPS